MTHIIKSNTDKKIRLLPELCINKISGDTFVRSFEGKYSGR